MKGILKKSRPSLLAGALTPQASQSRRASLGSANGEAIVKSRKSLTWGKSKVLEFFAPQKGDEPEPPAYSVRNRDAQRLIKTGQLSPVPVLKVAKQYEETLKGESMEVD